MVNVILQDLGLEKKEDNKLFTSGNVILQDLGLEKETIPSSTTKGKNKSSGGYSVHWCTIIRSRFRN